MRRIDKSIAQAGNHINDLKQASKQKREAMDRKVAPLNNYSMQSIHPSAPSSVRVYVWPAINHDFAKNDLLQPFYGKRQVLNDDSNNYKARSLTLS